LTIDAWENASDRDKTQFESGFAKDMWKIINWSKIEQRYAAAIKQNQKVKSVMVYCKPFDDEIIHSF